MQNNGLVRAKLKTPRAAAIAGILFSILFVAAFSLLRMVLPSDPCRSRRMAQNKYRGLSVLRSILSHSPELHFFGLLARCATGLVSTKTAFLLRFFWAAAWCF